MRKVWQGWLVAIVLMISLINVTAYQEVKKVPAPEMAQQVVSALVAQDFKAASKDFDATMLNVLNAEKLGPIWQGLIKQLGSFHKVINSRVENLGGVEIVIITCEFERTLIDAKVSIKNGQVIGLLFVPSTATAAGYTPASYVNKAAFKESEVVVGSGALSLPGTLAMPISQTNVPAIVLVHGSGPNDRDETIGPNKVFQDLAQGLASQGIAVLRYDKRTKVHPDKCQGEFTLQQETVEDALLAAELLRNTKGIDPQKVYVLGHSLGGMAIPRIGAQDSHLAGLIVFAGATRHLEDAIVEQMDYIAALPGHGSDLERQEIEKIKKAIAVVKDRQALAKLDKTAIVFGGPASYWLDLQDYNPPTAAQSLKQPLLILQGERDYQVTMKEFRSWQTALADHKNVTFKSYPQLNHLFIAGKGMSTPEEYQQSGHVAEEVVKDIANWLKR